MRRRCENGPYDAYLDHAVCTYQDLGTCGAGSREYCRDIRTAIQKFMPNTRSNRDNTAYQDAIVCILNEDEDGNTCPLTGHGRGQGRGHGRGNPTTQPPTVAWGSGGAGQLRGGGRGKGCGHTVTPIADLPEEEVRHL
ncbi:hypothetical protein M422DRAFT_254478 [Sphaerobolus stellatus SS14]|uniref:Uncharacterized protein n=1 Tax=Sphaerobolus stellatus (strain SS14) TaxID=990650 RepID=A0A0C9UH99_SPHS4|nr:hypothetical protein M422DRAFT_254478 [Sphaerobolus stellatus SS14]